jgi:hypothetical protein
MVTMLEFQISTLSIREAPRLQPQPEPIAGPSNEPVTSTWESEIARTPITDMVPPSIAAHPVPIPEPRPELLAAEMLEFQIVISLISQMDLKIALPVPIPDASDEPVASTLELEIKRDPIDVVVGNRPSLSSPAPVPIAEPPAPDEVLATTVEFQMTTLSTREIPLL